MTRIILELDPFTDQASSVNVTGLQDVPTRRIKELLSPFGRIIQFGLEEEAVTGPTPAPPQPQPPITGEPARAFTRRRIALEHAVNIVRDAIRSGLDLGNGHDLRGLDEGKTVVELANALESYLASGKASE